MSKQRRTFSAEFKREAAALVLDQGYSHCSGLLIPDTDLGENPRRERGV